MSHQRQELMNLMVWTVEHKEIGKYSSHEVFDRKFYLVVLLKLNHNCSVK